jgi:antitoxin component of MazEF toxin-antitoxin module
MRVKVRKVGNSLTVTIPYEIAEELAISEGGELDLAVQEDRIIAQPTSSRLDRVLAPLRKEAAEKGITPEMVDRAVREVRDERRSR